MAFEELVYEKYEIVTEFRHIQVIRVTTIMKDGKVVGRNSDRYKILTSNMDVSEENDEIKRLTMALWTDEVKAAYSDHLASLEE